MVEPGQVLWRPANDARETSALGRFLSRAESVTGLHFATYDDVWQWSVSDLDTFWQLVWDQAEIITHTKPTAVLGRREMPFAQWFPGATLNYAEHALRDQGSAVKVKARSQTRAAQDLNGAELAELVGRVQQGLRVLGVGQGRPRGRVPAEHPGGARHSPCSRGSRRDLVQRADRDGPAQRARPGRAA